jgi:Uma2 family endonuclease
MDPESVPQPDIDLLIESQFGGQSREETYGVGATELVVEVSYSTSARDAGAKLRLYERSGVREDMIVKPKKRDINWLELFEGKYRPIKPGPDGVFYSRIFPGLWLDPAGLWQRDFTAMRAVVERGLATPEHADFVRLLASGKQ